MIVHAMKGGQSLLVPGAKECPAFSGGEVYLRKTDTGNVKKE